MVRYYNEKKHLFLCKCEQRKIELGKDFMRQYDSF